MNVSVFRLPCSFSKAFKFVRATIYIPAGTPSSEAADPCYKVVLERHAVLCEACLLMEAALARFVDGLYDAGIVPIHTGTVALSTAMGEAEIDRLAQAVLDGLRRIETPVGR